MACNALTFAKGEVSDEQVFKLLTAEQVGAVVKAVLADVGYPGATVRQVGERTRIAAGGGRSLYVEVTAAGVIQVAGGYSVNTGRVTGLVAAALGMAAGSRYSAVLGEALTRLTGATPTVAEATIEENGQRARARVLKVRF